MIPEVSEEAQMMCVVLPQWHQRQRCNWSKRLLYLGLGR